MRFKFELIFSFIFIVELNTASSNLEMNDLTFGMGLDDSMSPHSSSAAVSSGTSSNSSNKFIHFSIHFDQRIFDIRLLSSATIGKYNYNNYKYLGTIY